MGERVQIGAGLGSDAADRGLMGPFMGFGWVDRGVHEMHSQCQVSCRKIRLGLSESESLHSLTSWDVMFTFRHHTVTQVTREKSSEK